MRTEFSRTMLVFLVIGNLGILSGCAAGRTEPLPPETAQSGSAAAEAGSLETVRYEIRYEEQTYTKTAYVYVPASYEEQEPMNIVYLLHGSQGSASQMAEDLAPLLDEWIRSGEIVPMLVVFPTYYPDRSFVQADYTQDYPLNHFFARQEVPLLLQAVESTYHTYAQSTDAQGLQQSRMHRAFGGYSMGGVTTWDVLALQADAFACYLPMAGDCWLDRLSDEPVEEQLMQGLLAGGYGPGDFRILAMVGSLDSTKYTMRPQIEALRSAYPDLINARNLLYWENEGGGHSQASLEAETEHGLSTLWKE